jgi:soluble lytic murein transglycosylase
MKQVTALAFALAVGSLPYVLAQPQAEEPARLPQASLSSTAHAALPKELSHYWFVPDPAELRASRVKRDSVIMGFARGVKAVMAADFTTGLPLVSPTSLDESRLRDYARYYRAVALQGLARLPEADAVLTALVESKPQGYLKEAASLKLAEVAVARKDFERAEQILRVLTGERLSAPEDAFLELGHTEEALGQSDRALEAYRRVYFGFPLSDKALDAKAAIDRLEAAGDVPAVSQADELSRAERLFAARRWADARAAFEALSLTRSGNDKDLALLRVAECDVHLGRHRAARDRLKPYLSSSSKADEARFFYLSAVRGVGDSAAYVTLSRALVDDFPDSPWAAETLNNLASYYVVEDQDGDADRVFRELLVRFPRHRYAERAAWKVGWAAYRSRQFAEAATLFESAAVTFSRADYRPAWLYWSGRAREQMGDRREAVARYQIVVADYGSSYYGRLVSRLLASQPDSPLPARVQIVTPTAAPEAPPTVAVMRALMVAGLFDDAIREVQYAQRTWGDTPQLQATLAWIRYQQAQNLRGDERFAALRGAITTMRRAYPQVLSAEGERVPAEVLRVIFPLDYWDLIEKQSSAHGLDPYLLAALMAQESTFTAEIRSSANARGLMQVMPGTGRRYARKLGITRFTTAALTQPEVNVRIGSRYFKDLMDQFGGAHYALASYNAGEARVERWLKDDPGLPPDEFIDNIPFPETQNYVKRILGTAEDYRRLYGTGLLTPNNGLGSSAAD